MSGDDQDQLPAAVAQHTALTTGEVSIGYLREALAFFEEMGESGLLPKKVESAADCVVLAGFGARFGFDPIRSLYSVHIIEGVPSLKADVMVGVVKASPACRFFICTESSTKKATFETHREGDPKPQSLSFTIEEAAAAQLANKSVWKKHPAAMLRARAAAALCRLVYPDILGGIYDPEELRRAPAGPQQATRPDDDDVTDAEFEEVPAKEERREHGTGQPEKCRSCNGTGHSRTARNGCSMCHGKGVVVYSKRPEPKPEGVNAGADARKAREEGEQAPQEEEGQRREGIGRQEFEDALRANGVPPEAVYHWKKWDDPADVPGLYRLNLLRKLEASADYRREFAESLQPGGWPAFGLFCQLLNFPRDAVEAYLEVGGLVLAEDNAAEAHAAIAENIDDFVAFLTGKQ